jgi:hypothetical protein
MNSPGQISWEQLLEYEYEIVFKDVAQKVTNILKDNWKNHCVLDHRTINGRTMLYRPTELPHYIFKVYNKSCDPHNPLSHILRVPMAHVVNKCIQDHNLTRLETIQKALIPLHELDTKDELFAEEVNRSFIVMAELKDIYSESETIKLVREMSAEDQLELCSQLCCVVEKTSLTDFGWHNIRLTRNTHKFVIIDTEPLYGEIYHPDYAGTYGGSTFDRVKQGISQLYVSSLDNKLPIFVKEIKAKWKDVLTCSR